MADSTRHQILDALAALLAGITAGATYRTSAGASVYMNPDAAVPEGELPAIVVRDEESVEAQSFGEEVHVLTVVFECLGSGAAGAQEARDVAADVMTALASSPTLGGLVGQIGPSRKGSLNVRPGEVPLAIETVTVDMEYATAIYGN